MHAVTTTINLPVAPKQAFRLIAALDRAEDWWAPHDHWMHHDPEEIAAATKDSRLRHHLSIIGIPIRVLWTVTRRSYPRLELRGTSPMDVEIRVHAEVKPAESGCVLHLKCEYGGPPVDGIIGESFARHVLAALEQSAENLKVVIG